MSRSLIVGSIVLVSIAVAFGVVGIRDKNTVRDDTYSLNKSRSELHRILKTDGMDAARAYVTALALQSDPGTTHELEHELGKELYLREGLAGIRQCEDTLFGCFHGFIGSAVADGGMSIVTSLEKYCGSGRRVDSCIHGVGHGILERAGYTDDGLKRALTLCDTLGASDTRKGCYQGAFMEYYTPTMTEGNIPVRNFDWENPLMPCPELSEHYTSSCYFELPGFWMAAIGDNFEQMGNFCDRIQYNDSRTACFRGIGQIAAGVSRFTPDVLKAICESMPTNDAVASCTTSAALQFAYKDDGSTARLLCMSLASDAQQECTRELEAIR